MIADIFNDKKLNPSNKKLQKITFNNSSDIDFQDFLNPIKGVLENDTPFYLLMLLLLQMILYVLERIL